MSIGTIGSAALNRVLMAAARLQAINHDPGLGAAAKRRMSAAIEKESAGILDADRQTDEAADRSSLLDPSTGTSEATPASASDAPTADGQPSRVTGAPDPNRKPQPDPLARGSVIDRIG